MPFKTRVMWTLHGDSPATALHVEFLRWLPGNLQIVRVDNAIVSILVNPVRHHQVHHLTIGPWRAYVESAAPGLPDPSLMIAGRLIPQDEPFDLGSLVTVT